MFNQSLIVFSRSWRTHDVEFDNPCVLPQFVWAIWALKSSVLWASRDFHELWPKESGWCHVSWPVSGAVHYACIDHIYSWHWFHRGWHEPRYSPNLFGFNHHILNSPWFSNIDSLIILRFGWLLEVFYDDFSFPYWKKYICILTFALATLRPHDPPGGPNPHVGKPWISIYRPIGSLK